MRKEFERVTPESVGISSEGIARFLDSLEGGHTQMHGLMIMRHGKVCAEGWWAPFAPGTPHMCNSLTKTYMGTAIGIAVTEGLLKIEDRLVDIFPEFAPENPSPYINELTVRNVLCMGSGMTAFPPDDGDWVKNFIAMPLNNRPGTAFFYNSVGSTFLGKIIEKLTGKNVYEYLAEKLFVKIGIDPDNLTYSPAPADRDMWAWRAVSTTEDNLRLMKLYADGGVWEGERILSEEYVRLATSFQNDSASEAKGNPTASDNFVGYGFQMWMCRYPGAYRADGAAGQFSIVIPSKDMIVSINEHTMQAQKTLDCVWEYLMPAVSDGELAENPDAQAALARRMRSLAVTAPEYAPYSEGKAAASGRYIVESGSFDLYCNAMGAKVEVQAREFDIEFGVMDGRISWTADDRTGCSLEFAMNGTRRYNRFPSPWQFARECWANGVWESGTRFRLELLWPEADVERALVFEFGEKRVEVSERRKMTPPGITPPAPAVAVRR